MKEMMMMMVMIEFSFGKRVEFSFVVLKQERIEESFQQEAFNFYSVFPLY